MDRRLSFHFDQFLSIMEAAWKGLTPEEFFALEEKIKAEIQHRRDNKGKKT